MVHCLDGRWPWTVFTGAVTQTVVMITLDDCSVVVPGHSNGYDLVQKKADSLWPLWANVVSVIVTSGFFLTVSESPMTRLISLICSSGNVTGDAAHVAEAMAVVTRAKIHIEALKRWSVEDFAACPSRSRSNAFSGGRKEGSGLGRLKACWKAASTGPDAPIRRFA